MAADEAAERSPEPDDGRPAGPPAGLRLIVACDGASREWLERLATHGRVRDEAVTELHALLVRAARFTLARRSGEIPALRRGTLDDLAVEAANDALVAVLARLPDYRGESRFTTWAAKFAFLHASSMFRRRSWMGREIPVEDAGLAALSREASPQRRLELRELFVALGRAIERRLTPHERAVFVAVALNGVPVDVLAERLGTTRGAVYKTLHDARHKLRAQFRT